MLLALRDDFAEGRADELRAEADWRSHHLIAAALARERPADAVLSEEGEDDHGRLAANRLWIVDPLDGTREFGEMAMSDWAVHIAVWAAGRLTTGVVALPARGHLFSAASPPHPSARPRPQLRMVVSRTRAPALAAAVAGVLGAEIEPMGSAGAKAMAVVRGDADIYLHVGNMHDWDVAAPAAVAAAAGLHVSRLDGSPIVYNLAEPVVPDLLVCRPELTERVIEAARHHRDRGDGTTGRS